MKRLTAIILVLCLGCQCVLKLAIVTWFELNREYIAATLCENRDKPELVCCGKCVLTKELKKADQREDTDKKATQKAERYSTVSFVLPQISQGMAMPVFSMLNVMHPVIPHHFGTTILRSVFHPPAATLYS